MIVLLHRVMGDEKVANFEMWMFLFVNVICAGNQFIDWGSIISDNLHYQLTNFELNEHFYMSSYLFYAIACMKSWPGLATKGTYDNMT